MTNDNYKATDSSLIDPPEPAAPPRPRNVSIALGLIVGAMLISLLALLKALQDTNFYGLNTLGMAMFAAEIVLLVVICQQIARGRRWPRLLLLMLVLVTFARLCWSIGYVWRQAPELSEVFLDPYYLLTRLLPLGLSLIALHLLYFSSGDWFRPRN